MPQWRKTHRLRDYDYSLPGAYFSTICEIRRRPLFGKVVDGEMALSPLGELIDRMWREQVDHFSGLLPDVHCVMPNHFHAVVAITSGPTAESEPKRIATLPVVMRAFKGFTTLAAQREGWIERGEALFQDDYYDHVIRNDHALERIREYIFNNPQQWHLDQENAKRSGTNPFYSWLEEVAAELPL